MKMNLKNLKIDEWLEQGRLWLRYRTTVSLGKRSYTLQPFRFVLALIAGVLLLSILVNILSIPGRRPRTLVMDFNAGSNYAMEPYRDDIILYNNQNLRAIDSKGNILWTVNKPMSHPVAATAGNYILMADLGGNNEADLYQNGDLIQEFQLGNDIIAAEVSKDGDCAFATATLGYKGRVVVFDKKGNETFSWNSGEGYITDLALHEDGHHLAVAQMLSSDNKTNSRIQFIDLRQKKVLRSADCPDALIHELRFSKNRLIAVSDLSLMGFKPNGKHVYTVSFAGKHPGNYDITGDDRLAFVTKGNRGNTVLELYNTSGRLKGSYHTETGIHSLATWKDMTVITQQRKVLYINQRGKQKKSVSIDHDIKGVGVFGDGKTVLVLGSTAAEILHMR